MAADGSIVLETTVDNTGIDKGLKNIKTGVDSISKAFTKLGGIVASALSVAALIRFTKESTELASNIQEVQNVVDTAFGDMSYKVENFAKTAIDSVGMSKLSVKEMASTFMAMGTGMGQAVELGSDKAVEMTARLGDVMSFYNKTLSEANTIGRAVYSGETEPLKQIGIVMTQNNLELFAMQNGYKKLYSAMSSGEQLLVRQEFFLNATRLAAGDFVKTQDSWANQTRILSERYKEMQAEFGKAFMVIGQVFMPMLNSLITGLTQVAKMAQIAAQWIYKAFTGKTLELKAAEQQSSAIGGAVTNQEDLTDAVNDTGKATKKLLAPFDDLNVLTEKAVTTQQDFASGITSGVDVGGVPGNEDSGFDMSQYEELAERLQSILTLTGFIGAGLLAWKISTMLPSDLTKMTELFTKIYGIVLIVAGAMLLIDGYSDAWVNGIDWKSFLEILAGAALLIGGIAILLGPEAAAWAALGLGIAIVVLAIKDMIDNGPNWINILTLAAGAMLVVAAAMFLVNIPISIIPFLIIAAIAAIALLIVYWKDVKKWALDAWSKICEAWGKFADWFVEKVWNPFMDQLKAVGNFFIDIINGMISGFEGFVNFVLAGVNKIIDALNKLSFDIPDWVPLIGGNSWGFDIPNVQPISLGRIPKLAQGAVIPPNREFMAILGDQRSGLNIETPLETMIQAFKTALGEGQGQAANITLMLDGRVLGKVTIDQINSITQTTGVSPILV